MTTLTINSESTLQKALGDLREMFKAHKFIKLTARTGKDRTLDQNAIGHAWYQQIETELREDDALGWKCFCKLHHGVPILRAEDEQFRAFYDQSIKGLAYEQKLTAMKFVPVTSIMTTPQKSKYLAAVQADFRGRGVMLEFPKD